MRRMLVRGIVGASGILRVVQWHSVALRAAVLTLTIVLCGSRALSAQPREAHVDARVTAYGDNTEFANPFRVGETLLGAFVTLALEARLSERLAVRAGVFGHQRFGSDRAFDEVRPVLALVIGGPRSRLVFGTIQAPDVVDAPGPDRLGPHGLLPPVQRETLAFERPWEAGLQWLIESPRVRQDAWINWQQIAREGQRERFDTGIRSRISLRPGVAFRGEAHLVHQGGQVPAAEPVADSYAAALGFEAGGPAGPFDRVSVEALALVSRHVPDRDDRVPRMTGLGTFLRLALEDGRWRTHGILFRGDGFAKWEGDPHYGSLRLDGTRFFALRDYLEVGLTRRVDLAPRSWLEASARWHRVESDYEYSFRVMAVTALRWRVR